MTKEPVYDTFIDINRFITEDKSSAYTRRLLSTISTKYLLSNVDPIFWIFPEDHTEFNGFTHVCLDNRTHEGIPILTIFMISNN